MNYLSKTSNLYLLIVIKKKKLMGASYGDFYNPDSTIMRPDGLHVLTCRETGNGGALGLTSGRHTHVKFTVIGVIKKFGSKTASPLIAMATSRSPSARTYSLLKADSE